MANETNKICLGPKALLSLSSYGTHLETYSYYENVPMVPNETILQLYSQILVSGQMQLYCILCNYMQLYCNYMQLGVAISTLCNYMTDRCGNFNFMQLNATICNCVGTKNVYWHGNFSSCFNEFRYHQIGFCQIYLPRVMIKI